MFGLALRFSRKVLGPGKWVLENTNVIVVHIKFWLGLNYGFGIMQCELNDFYHVYFCKNEIRREMFLTNNYLS